VWLGMGPLWPLATRGGTVDFVPYEGGSPKPGRDVKGLIIAVALGFAVLGGAWRLAAAYPAKNVPALENMGVYVPSVVVDNIASSDTDFGPGEVECQVARHPVAAR
jgi:hypothetical protein